MAPSGQHVSSLASELGGAMLESYLNSCSMPLESTEQISHLSGSQVAAHPPSFLLYLRHVGFNEGSPCCLRKFTATGTCWAVVRGSGPGSDRCDINPLHSLPHQGSTLSRCLGRFLLMLRMGYWRLLAYSFGCKRPRPATCTVCWLL